MTLATEIEFVQALADREIEHLKSASEALRGLEIVKLFLLDILGVSISSFVISAHSLPAIYLFVVFPIARYCRRENIYEQDGRRVRYTLPFFFNFLTFISLL